MIYRLQKKFILISAAAVFLVVVLIFLLITVLNVSSMNRTLDTLADGISSGGGKFPDSFGEVEMPNRRPIEDANFDFITPETRFSTRHFTVWFDDEGALLKVNAESIHSVTEAEATAYAEKVIDGKERGWISHYRYKVFSVKDTKAVVFIDGSMNRSSLLQSTVITAIVLLSCAFVILLLIILLSKRVMKPVAESYAKQKQFVTDANHELKTPLTLILTNLDIAQAELGKNEWLDDIRTEGERMTELVNQLVALSRMDEDGETLNRTELRMGELVSDTVSEFATLSAEKGKPLSAEVEGDILYNGDEMLLRRLLSILLDNAVKYCDEDGCIHVTLKKGRGVILTVENTYRAVDRVELDRLFDRFYRADKARTYTGGFGIGLSIAKSIAQKHKGDIVAYKKDDAFIGFRVVLR